MEKRIERRVEKICVFVIIVAIVVGMILGITKLVRLYYTYTLALEATIVGKVYIDTNRNLALDYEDIPADGVKLALHSVTEKMIMVDEVAVDQNGEYRFEGCKEGEYCINVVFQMGPYQLPFNGYQVLGINSLGVQKGEIVVIGPTILLYIAPDIEDRTGLG